MVQNIYRTIKSYNKSFIHYYTIDNSYKAMYILLTQDSSKAGKKVLFINILS